MRSCRRSELTNTQLSSHSHTARRLTIPRSAAQIHERRVQCLTASGFTKAALAHIHAQPALLSGRDHL